MHAALWLVVALGGLAVEYLLLTAEFIAWVQVLIYVGSVVVLLLFGLMLTRAPIGRSPDADSGNRWAALAVALAAAAALVWVVVDAFRTTWIDLDGPAPGSTRSPARASSSTGSSPSRPSPSCSSPPWSARSSCPARTTETATTAPGTGGPIGTDRASAHPATGPPDATGPARARRSPLMHLAYPAVLSALLFCTGLYGVLARRNAILVLMSVELMLNAVNLNLVAFDVWLSKAAEETLHSGQALTLFTIAIAAAEIGIGLAIVLAVYRNRGTADIDKLRDTAEGHEIRRPRPRRLRRPPQGREG